MAEKLVCTAAGSTTDLRYVVLRLLNWDFLSILADRYGALKFIVKRI